MLHSMIVGVNLIINNNDQFVLNFLNIKKEKLKNWLIRHAEGPHGKFWLSAISFAESSFFPIPPDVILIAILMAKQAHHWFFYSFLTTIFSVFGGLFGYLIGFLFFNAVGQKIVDFYNLQNQVQIVGAYFQQNAFWSIFIAAFTPIPYKVFTIAAGLFKINLPIFILASILGRGLRFFAVSYLMKLYGARLGSIIYKYFNIFSVVLVILILMTVYLLV